MAAVEVARAVMAVMMFLQDEDAEAEASGEEAEGARVGVGPWGGCPGTLDGMAAAGRVGSGGEGHSGGNVGGTGLARIHTGGT